MSSSSAAAAAAAMQSAAEPQQSASVGQFKSFVTQSQLDEKRLKRQEEWDKVRQPDQPLEVPEEQYDSRSLFYRLQEQKDKKQAEFEESHKLKNMIKGLDDDEVNFLDFVEKTREEIEVRRLEEEGREMAEYRKAVATLAEKTEGQRLQELKDATMGVVQLTASVAPTTQRKTSQSALLAGAVKRKSVDKTEDVEDARKRLKSDSSADCSAAITPSPPPVAVAVLVDQPSSQLTCVGVLPGLGVYTDSSDSDQSSNDESDTELMHNSTNYDLLGRTRWQAAATQAATTSHGATKG